MAALSAAAFHAARSVSDSCCISGGGLKSSSEIRTHILNGLGIIEPSHSVPYCGPQLPQ